LSLKEREKERERERDIKCLRSSSWVTLFLDSGFSLRFWKLARTQRKRREMGEEREDRRGGRGDDG
jgi:hypothetical protein